jgi:hypothetical protein
MKNIRYICLLLLYGAAQKYQRYSVFAFHVSDMEQTAHDTFSLVIPLISFWASSARRFEKLRKVRKTNEIGNLRFISLQIFFFRIPRDTSNVEGHWDGYL